MKPEHRFPAEWEAVEAVLVAWPHTDTDWGYMLDQVRDCYRNLIAAISRHARVIVAGPERPDIEGQNIEWVKVPTNDTWTRDYGPLTVFDNNGNALLLDYKFNGWGLKFAADRDNLVTSRLCRDGVLKHHRINRLSFVLEGGSIESDGRGTAIVTADCLLSPNRNGGMSKEEIERQLVEDLGLDRLLWLTKGALEGDDTDGHIDTLVRIAPPGDILFYVACRDENDSHHAELQAMEAELRTLRTAAGKPYRLVALPLPPPIFDEDDGTRLPATYANFLFVNNAVLVPVYNVDTDAEALATIAATLPDYEVVPVDCRALIRQHGSLHCATMQLP